MKKLKEKMPFIGLILLSIVLLVVLIVPTSILSGAQILKCQSGTCLCVCLDPYQCQCCAGGGKCACVCLDGALDRSCPEDDGGGGGGSHPPYWY